MPKRVFWPAALAIMGVVTLAAFMGYLPANLWFLWPLILIVVGLGGLILSDKEEWEIDDASTSKPTVAKKKATTAKKTVKSSKTSKSKATKTAKTARSSRKK